MESQETPDPPIQENQPPPQPADQNYQQLIDENASLQKQLEALQASIETMKQSQAQEDADSQIQQLIQTNSELERRLKESEEELSKKEGVEELQAQIRKLKDENNALIKQKEEIQQKQQQDIEKLKQDIAQAQAEEVSAGDLQKLQDKLAIMGQELEATRHDLELERKKAKESETKMVNDSLAQVKMLESRIREQEAIGKMHRNKLMAQTQKQVQADIISNDLKVWVSAAQRIQARWKGYKQRKKYLQMLQRYVKQQTLFVKAGNNSDQLLMNTVYREVKKKNMTLEQCYRAADADQDGIVTCDEFIRFLTGLKLNITRAQYSRMILIFDENVSGKLEKDEFYRTLSAYYIDSESNRKFPYTYAQEILMKFSQMLENRGITPEEMFSLCDDNNAGKISIKDFEKSVFALDFGFQRKDIHALISILDADSIGYIQKEDFIKHIGRTTNVFQFESSGAATHSSAPNQHFQSSPTVSKESIQAIVRKMESRGMSLQEAFEHAQPDAHGKMTIAGFTRFLNQWFPDVQGNEVNLLVNELDLDKNLMIDAQEMQDFLLQFSTISRPSLPLTLKGVATRIQKTGLTTAEYFQRQGVPKSLTLEELSEGFGSWMRLTEEQCQLIFENLDQSNGKVLTVELMDVINRHRIGDESPPVSPGKVNQLVSPRARHQQTLDDFASALADFRLGPKNIFRFADKGKTGQVSLDNYKAAVKKLIPNFNDQLLQRIGNVLPPQITVKDIEALFLQQQEQGEVQDQHGNAQEKVYWLRRLIKALQNSDVDQRVLFDIADTNKDQYANMSELRIAINHCIPITQLSIVDVGYIIKVLDINQGKPISFNQYSNLLQQAQTSSHITEMPQEKTAVSFLDVSEPIQGTFSMRNQPTQQQLRLITKAKPTPIKILCAGISATYLDKFIKTLPNIPVIEYFHQEERFPQGIYNLERFEMLCSRHAVSKPEAIELFRALDTHQKGSIYAYVLFTVLDSFRQNLDTLPIAQNTTANHNKRVLLNEIVKGIPAEPPLYTLFPKKLDETIENWGKELQFLGVWALDGEELREHFPTPCYYYHLAAVLQSYQPSVSLCGDEIMHCIFETNNVKSQAPEFLTPFGIQSTDLIDKKDFMTKCTDILGMRPIESDAVYKKVYQDRRGELPIYEFFTYFDRIFSMYNRGVLEYKMPKLPMKNQQSNDRRTQTYFSRLTELLKQPLSTYGLIPSSQLTVNELCELLERAVQIQKFESTTFISQLIMNSNQRIRIYHLLTVLDSYRGRPMSLISIPIDAMKALSANAPPNSSGRLVLREQYHVQLSAALNKESFKMAANTLNSVQQESLFSFLDVQEAGLIYGHSLATIIDIAINYGDHAMGAFPLYQNQRTTKDVREILSSHARTLDEYHKNAYEYYIECGFQPEERLVLEQFVKKFEQEMTRVEAETVFNSMEMNQCGFLHLKFLQGVKGTPEKTTGTLAIICTGSFLETQTLACGYIISGLENS